MKNVYKLMAVAALGCSALISQAQLVETRAYYSTNASNAVGKSGTITIDGEFSDWTEDMIISTCGANDEANAFKGSHENCVLDMYALYAAWDNDNLYLAWQMCNTGDTWAREGDGPLCDGGRIGDVPLIVALSVNPGNPGMTGKLTQGGYIWGDNVEFSSHVDHLFYMSGKPGLGTPAMFKAVNAQGATDYGSGCTNFSVAGIQYKMKEGFHPSHLWRHKGTKDLEGIYDAANYDNLKAGPVSGLKPHDTQFDSFYEMKIPLRTLGINREWLEENGIGVRVVATRGESGLDCIPFDPSMVDNVMGDYAKDPSTSHEKDDTDIITYDLANIAKMRDGSVTPPPGPVEPEPDPEPDPEDPTDEYFHAYFVDSTCGWSPVYTWIWDSTNNKLNYTGGNWPGSQMESMNVPNYGQGWHYKFKPDSKSQSLMIIFNNGIGGNGNQTADLVFENNGVYNAGGKIGKYSVVKTVAADDICIYGMTISLNGTGTLYNLSGQKVAQGSGTLTAPACGLYILVTSTGTRKLVVK